AAAFQPRNDHTKHRIDYAGAALLAGGLSGTVLYTSLGGTTYAWGSASMIALIAGGAGLLATFLLAERRAKEPIVPLEIFRTACSASPAPWASSSGSPCSARSPPSLSTSKT